MRSELLLFQIVQNRSLKGCSWGIDRRDRQHGNNPLALVVRAFWMAPCKATAGLGVAVQIKDFDLTLPYCLALELLVDGDGFAVNCSALVQFLNRDLEPVEVSVPV